MEGLELKDRFIVPQMSTIGIRKRKYPSPSSYFYIIAVAVQLRFYVIAVVQQLQFDSQKGGIVWKNYISQLQEHIIIMEQILWSQGWK